MAKSEKQEKQKAIDRNYEAFKGLLPGLLETHPGKFVVMRDGKVIETFDTVRDAMVFGTKKFDDGLFSVQEITDTAVDLGFFSHALRYSSV